MVRYFLTAATAVVLLSGAAMADETTIIRGPSGVSKSTTEQHMNANGDVVTDKKTSKDGFSGSTTTDTKTVTDPAGGDTVTRSRTTTTDR